MAKSTDRWQRIEQVYHSALEREESQRADFLTEACAGDDELRQEVESLLAQGGGANSFLEAPALEAAARMFSKEQGQSLIGRQMGPYQIASLLGVGGMGEVYQALDTKLGRNVAIKVLPEAFAHDPERLSRFQREAKMLASLNHPNIATIYWLEQSNGTSYLVMELVAGETLAERIKRKGAVPIEEALTICKQIAEALEAAHEKGIIHRDLKPANVKVTPEGKVKVLDFGLAKAFGGKSEADLAKGPTLSEEGRILGTPAYMSPEQARGKTTETDKRTDIWAFGCVLYELLTGRAAFRGETVSDTIAAVLEREPDRRALPAGTPAQIRMLLKRCLQKDKSLRLQAAGDARIELHEALTAPIGVDAVASATESGRRRMLKAVAAIAVAATIALSIFTMVRSRRTPGSAPETRTEIVTPATTDPASFALSPDGRMIVFAASGDGLLRLWLRRLDATEAQPLAGTEGASRPFWSPDSRSVGFFAGGKLKRLDPEGGLPQTLANINAVGGTWSRDGTILIGTFESTLFRVPASGGEPIPATKLDRQTSHRNPQFLPDGRQFLFYAQGPGEAGGIYLGSLDNPETKRLIATGAVAACMPNGWLLFMRGSTLVAQRLDLGRKELVGDASTVADPVASSFSVSDNGLVAYRSGGGSRSQMVWFDRSGKMLGTLGPPDTGFWGVPSLSPDGRRVAAQRSVQDNLDIWILEETHMTRLTFDPGVDRVPVWSPDGSRIVFDSNRSGQRDLYVKAADGSGGEELLLHSSEQKDPDGWSRDGRFLIYQSSDPQTSQDIWVLPMEGDHKPFVFLKTNFDERYAKFSPDGRWVAYRSNESGRYEIYVRPFNGRSPTPGEAYSGQRQVSTSGGTDPRWRSDGKELYYVAPDLKMMAVPIGTNGVTLQLGTPVALFQTRIVGGGTPNAGSQYDISRDGRFLINTVLEEAAPPPITLLQNWNPELKK